jgi:hypothetical protein
MSLRPSFGTNSKTNAIRTLIAGVVMCLMLAFVAYEFVASRGRERAVKLGSAGHEAPTEALSVGRFETIAGTSFMLAPLTPQQNDALDSYAKVARAIGRNYLFVNHTDLSSHWLLPGNVSLILSMEEIAEHVDLKGCDAREARPIKWLLFRVVTEDTNKDGKLSDEDSVNLAVSDPDGTHYVEVLKRADPGIGFTRVSNERLILDYRSSGRRFLADLNLPARTLGTPKELPQPGK